MKLNLHIEASAAVLARIIAAVADEPASAVTVGTAAPEAVIPPVPMMPTAPIMHNMLATDPQHAPMQQQPESDDDGPVDDGAPAVDSSGMPWDERIHAKTKATVADGTWRQKRGVDKALVAQVEAELRGSQPVAQPTFVPPMPAAQSEVQMQPVQAPPLPVPAQSDAMPLPIQQPPAPVPVPAMAQPAPTATITPADFMVKLGALMAGDSPLVDQDYLIILTNRFNAAYGTQYNAVTDAMMNPQHLALIVQMMQMDQRWN